MSTVLKEFGIRRAVAGDIGVEIEVEGTNIPITEKYWSNEEDGSLKGESREFVLRKPSTLREVKTALEYLNALYNSNDTKVDDSVRAGVHIHINCQKLTMTQLYNFMVIYLILENILVKWCGNYRQGNLFCLRACDAEYLLEEISAAANDKKKMYVQRFKTDNLRYASMNVKALGDYGSLEFRAMRGTRDLDLIYKWAETLLGLREFACSFDNPQAIIEMFSMTGPSGFAREALGANAAMFNCPNHDKLVWDGMRNAQDIAYCTDWQKFEPKMKTVGGIEFPDYLKAEEINEPEEDY